jgi:hypothetical protein
MEYWLLVSSLCEKSRVRSPSQAKRFRWWSRSSLALAVLESPEMEKKGRLEIERDE